MKTKFAKISCIDDYIYVVEINSISTTNYFKKKEKQKK